MGSDGASADTEKKANKDARPPAAEKKPDGTGVATAAPPGAVAATSLGQRQLQAKSTVGGADDEAERKADQSAERIMRMADPKPPEGAFSAASPAGGSASAMPAPAATPAGPAAPASSAGGSAAGPTPSAAPSAAPSAEPPLRRADDPAAEQKVPGTPTVKPTGEGSAGGAGPDTATPAGPAPLVSPPIAAGAKPAESATPAPDPEPPAPEGQAPARETPVVPPEMQEYLDASRGKGAPLPEAVRTVFEAKFQRPFDDVRIHDEAGADDAACRIDAIAFTRGNDIYFRSAAYDPASPEGKRLLAHELTHVVQQRPGVNRKVGPGLGGSLIRRKNTPSAKKPGKKGPEGTITGNTIEIAKLSVPKFKVGRSGAGPYKVRKGKREDNPTKQASLWRSESKPKVADAVRSRVEELKKSPKANQTGDPAFYLSLKGEEFYLIGTESSITTDSRVPVWDKKGDRRSFDIDHKREAQLGGEDKLDNLWLLDSAKNRSAGSTIRANIEATLSDFLSQTAPDQGLSKVPSLAEVQDANKKWVVQFKELVPDKVDVKDAEYWEVTDFTDTKDGLLKRFEFADTKTVERLSGTPTKLSIFDRASGGGVRYIKRTGDHSDIKGWKAGAYEFTGVDFAESDQGASSGRLHGTAFRDKPNGAIEAADFNPPLKIRKLPGVIWGGVVTPGAIDYWRAKAFSPITIPEPEFDVNKGLVGRGKIPKPTIKLLEKVDFSVVLDGDVSLQAEISAADLTLPGPFKVLGGSMVVSAGLSGVGVRGDINFEIEKLAKGRIGAGAKTGSQGSALELEGELNFDTKMFTQADLNLSYKDGKWGVKGELEVGPDKIKGIKRASAKVEVTDGTVKATGEFEPTLKGIQKGTLDFKYNETTGMEITGEILLGQGIPGIKSGRLGATIKEGPDKHSLSGDVSLEPSVPGLTGSVTGKYEDGAFLVDAQLGYEKGFAKGTVHVGVTNQAVGPDGKPSGPPKPDGSLLVYGDGSVTLTLTPWLKGTVGLKLTPDGQVEVSGEVALPPTFDVFPEKTVDKTLLSIHVDVPIIGVAAAGQRIGIFATVGGALSFSAGIGPGQLRDVALKVTYNPAKPDDTTVTGNAKFAVPAHAGLRLTVEGALGVGIPVVSAKAGLQVYGEIGVAGEASAATQVTWTPRAGVMLDAKAEIFVEPKFKFGIDAFVDVSADLVLTEIELYHKTWKLAAFEYGSNLRFGLALPVHYESGKQFDVSFDQIQLTYPHIEPKELLSGLVKQMVG